MKEHFKDRRHFFAAIFMIILLWVIPIFLLVCPKNITKTSFNEFISQAEQIKDFETEGNTLRAVSDDPWIVHTYQNTNINTVKINIESISDGYKGSEIFVFYSDESYDLIPCTLHEGKNIISLNPDPKKTIAYIRYDLLVSEGNELGISDISVFKQGLPLKYVFVISVAIILLILIFIFRIKIIRAVSMAFRILETKRAALTAVIITGFYLITAVSEFALFNPRSMTTDELVKNADYMTGFDYDGNKFYSENSDPQILYDYDIKNIRNLRIDVSYIPENYTFSEIYVMSEDETFERYETVLSEGANFIELEGFTNNADKIRFDFLVDKNQYIGIDSITANSLSAALKYETMWFVSALAVLFSVILGKKARKKFSFRPKLSKVAFSLRFLFIAFFAALCWYVCFFAGYLAILPLIAGCIFMGWIYKPEPVKSVISLIICCCVFLISIAASFYIFTDMTGIGIFMGISTENAVKLVLSFFIQFSSGAGAIITLTEKEAEDDLYNIGKYDYIGAFADLSLIFVMTILLEALAKHYFESFGIIGSVREAVFHPAIYINFLVVGFVYYALRYLFGSAAGRYISVLTYLLYFGGNIIKLKFHNDILKPMDILQFRDFMNIATRYVHISLFYILGFFIAAALVLIIYINRKNIRYLLPDIFMPATCITMLLSLNGMITTDKFSEIGIINGHLPTGTEYNVFLRGLPVYSLYEFSLISDIFPKSVENYSEEYIKELFKDFENKHSENSDSGDIKPNVILIMEESMFDVADVPDINISMTVSENMNKYKKGNIISPVYGGGTAKAEFEALTGLSNYYLLPNIQPYLTYLSGKDKDSVPGLVREFNNNGYYTSAFHPNLGYVYSRDKTYSAMGFDDFTDLPKMEYTEEDLTDDNFLRDSSLADIISQRLNEKEEPQFIFAVTIENHMFYESKYNETEVKVTSDKLNEKELHSLEQYTQGVLDADRFVGKMVDITKACDRPTLLYIWGDHLPPLDALSSLGYINDKYNKYTTPIIAYSNYKDIEIGEEYISPNQLAPQILRDAQIPYSGYFDFIYSLRDNFPVIQSEFITDKENEELKKYEILQYDILFGKQYAAE